MCTLTKGLLGRITYIFFKENKKSQYNIEYTLLFVAFHFFLNLTKESKNKLQLLAENAAI